MTKLKRTLNQFKLEDQLFHTFMIIFHPALFLLTFKTCMTDKSILNMLGIIFLGGVLGCFLVRFFAASNMNFRSRRGTVFVIIPYLEYVVNAIITKSSYINIHNNSVIMWLITIGLYLFLGCLIYSEGLEEGKPRYEHLFAAFAVYTLYVIFLAYSGFSPDSYAYYDISRH